MVLSSQPNLVVSGQHSQRRMLQIPVEHLAVPDATPRRALAVTVSRELPLAGVLGRLVEGLPMQPEPPPAEAEHLARSTVELVRGLIATVVGDERPACQAREPTLQLHVVDYLRMHWHEHDLTAERLAAAHHISTRQLYGCSPRRASPSETGCANDGSWPAARSSPGPGRLSFPSPPWEGGGAFLTRPTSAARSRPPSASRHCSGACSRSTTDKSRPSGLSGASGTRRPKSTPSRRRLEQRPQRHVVLVGGHAGSQDLVNPVQ